MQQSEFPAISIILVNYNGIDDTIECIQSLIKTEYPNFNVIVVDNGEDIEEHKKLHLCYPEIMIIRTENNGFAAANNIGINKALLSNPEFILLLNNDTIVEKNFFSNIIIHLGKSDIGIFTPKINYYSNKDIIWSAGGKISKIKADAYRYHFNKPSKLVMKDQYVSFSSACCMLIKSEVFGNVGLFDEKFFLYFEDTDFCKRVTNKGYKILLLPQSIVYHKVSSATNKDDKDKKIYYHFRNRLYFAKKHYPELFFIISSFLLLKSIKLKLEWKIKGEKRKLKYAKEAIKDFRNNKMGKK